MLFFNTRKFFLPYYTPLLLLNSMQALYSSQNLSYFVLKFLSVVPQTLLFYFLNKATLLRTLVYI